MPDSEPTATDNSEAEMQDDLFPDDPRRETSPSMRDREIAVLQYATSRERGITLHGIMRDIVPHRAEAAYLMGSLTRKGMLNNTGRIRNGCHICEISQNGRQFLLSQQR